LEKNTLKQFLFLITKAAKENAAIVYAEDVYSINNIEYNEQFLAVQVTNPKANLGSTYKLDLSGIYQSKNLITVLTAIQILQNQGWNIIEENVTMGLRQVKK
jgi:dihydrofolate synthase/folylpolyglutamate synthase